MLQHRSYSMRLSQSPRVFRAHCAENMYSRRTCFYIVQDSMRLSHSPRVFRARGAENLYSRRADFHIVQYSMRLLCTNLRHLSIARCVREGQRRREVRKKSLNGTPRVPFRLRLFISSFSCPCRPHVCRSSPPRRRRSRRRGRPRRPPARRAAPSSYPKPAARRRRSVRRPTPPAPIRRRIRR